MLRKIVIVLIVILVVLQFIRPERNHSASASPDDITAHYNVPENVQAILQKACYDCHSNNTNYPWYTNIQPFGLWMQNHVNEGKEELNFSVFNTYSPKKKAHKMGEVVEMVEQGEMPLDSYKWGHKEARLSEEESSLLVSWASALEQQIKQQQ